jgi:hypothetical protein
MLLLFLALQVIEQKTPLQNAGGQTNKQTTIKFMY